MVVYLVVCKYSMENQTFSFRYNNNRSEDAFYRVSVSVESIEQQKYYDIRIQYDFHPMSLKTDREIKLYKTLMHPFYLRGGLTQYNFSEERDNIDGMIVLQNELTTKHLEHLSMLDHKLEPICSPMNVQKYRKCIMIALCYFIRL